MGPGTRSAKFVGALAELRIESKPAGRLEVLRVDLGEQLGAAPRP